MNIYDIRIALAKKWRACFFYSDFHPAVFQLFFAAKKCARAENTAKLDPAIDQIEHRERCHRIRASLISGKPGSDGFPRPGSPANEWNSSPIAPLHQDGSITDIYRCIALCCCCKSFIKTYVWRQALGTKGIDSVEHEIQSWNIGKADRRQRKDRLLALRVVWSYSLFLHA